MRQNPSFALTHPMAIKQLIRDNPWATLVSSTSEGLVASHYPVVVDERCEELSILTHLGRPDDVVHELGGEMLVIVQGPHGYISPGWYDAKPAVPTWNFVTAHLAGVPEVLTQEENWQVLEQLVRHGDDGRSGGHPTFRHRHDRWRVVRHPGIGPGDLARGRPALGRSSP